MAAARASWRIPKLCPKLLAPRLVRLASNTAKPRVRHNQHSQSKPLGRLLPEKIRTWYFTDGVVRTNKENREFLLRHDIELDNGLVQRLPNTAGLKEVCRRFAVMVGFSPRHVVAPQHLIYFSPFGHGSARHAQAKYARMSLEEPLWIITSIHSSDAAVVRLTAQRRLVGAVCKALEAMGYGRRGLAGGGHAEIRGTLWIKIHDPVVAVNQPAKVFAQAIIPALQRACQAAESSRPGGGDDNPQPREVPRQTRGSK